MNICLVGYGAIAEEHMKAFRRIGGIHPHVLVGRRPEPSNEFARTWGFAHHTLDLEAALSDPQVDAVVITSPNELHCSQAELALDAGKHVLLEIPMATNYDDARRLAERSRTVDRRLMVCHSMRFMPTLMEVKRRVAEGQLRIHHMVSFFGILRRSNTSWTGQKRSWTDNILWHHGGHLVDLAMWMVGAKEAVHVNCRFGPSHPTQKIMDMAMTIELPGGVLVSIAESYNISNYRWRALFIGEEATLEFCEGTLLDGDGNEIVDRHPNVDLESQNRDFVAAVREGRDPAITGEDVLPAMRVLQQAQSTAET